MAKTLSYKAHQALTHNQPKQIAFIWALRGTIAAGGTIAVASGVRIRTAVTFRGCRRPPHSDGRCRRLLSQPSQSDGLQQCDLAARSDSRISGQGTMVARDRADAVTHQLGSGEKTRIGFVSQKR